MNIVLTGSSTGIGRALAERLLSRGHHVWGLARSDQSDFAAHHPNFRFSRCDVADYTAVATTADALSAVWPHLDAVITAAGLQGEIAPALAADPARWSATVRANLDGTFHAIRAFAPLLARSPDRQKIICFSGGGATKARANFSAYAVAKTAIVRLVETIAEENPDRPLDINALAPGAITTRLTDEVLALGPAIVGAAEFAAAQKQKAATLASLSSATTGPLADPALARALDCVEWLLSPASDGITGRLLSAPWDSWPTLGEHREALATSDLYTLRRIVPADRALKW